MAATHCTHLDSIELATANSTGCEDCTRIGATWLHLRRCTKCGHVGCCDSSPNRHATAHFMSSGHPIVQSYEPGEDWLWCFVDDLAFEADELRGSASHP